MTLPGREDRELAVWILPVLFLFFSGGEGVETQGNVFKML